MFQATIDPVAGSLPLSALTACVPLLVFFIVLVGFKAKAHVSALIALAAALVVAVAAFRMPVELALLSATQGFVYGAFPIVFIIVMAVWFYQVTVRAGRFKDLRRFFDIVGGGDVRIQAVLVAFCFGGLLEALAGFGAPIAITATMVLALGVKPLRAALAVLIANTAPVAYGAVGTPITMAGSMVSGGDAQIAAETAQHVAALVGTQAPLFALAVPMLVMLVLDGRRGVADTWPPMLVIGVSFAFTQWWCSTHFAFELTDVVASLVSLGIAVAFMRLWKPRGVDEARARFGLAPAAEADRESLPAVRAWMALLPYVIVVAVFAVGKLGIPALLAGFDVKIAWPGLAGNVLNAAGSDPGTTYTLNWLSNPRHDAFRGGSAHGAALQRLRRERGVQDHARRRIRRACLDRLFHALFGPCHRVDPRVGLRDEFFGADDRHRPIPGGKRVFVRVALSGARMGGDGGHGLGYVGECAVRKPAA